MIRPQTQGRSESMRWGKPPRTNANKATADPATGLPPRLGNNPVDGHVRRGAHVRRVSSSPQPYSIAKFVLTPSVAPVAVSCVGYRSRCLSLVRSGSQDAPAPPPARGG